MNKQIIFYSSPCTSRRLAKTLWWEISVFGYSDPNTGINQSGLAQYTYYFINLTLNISFSFISSSTTKLSILTSCVFALQIKGVIGISLASTSLIFTVVFTVFQLLFLLSSQSDPFIPLENALAAIFLRHPNDSATVSGNEHKKKSDQKILEINFFVRSVYIYFHAWFCSRNRNPLFWHG